MSDLKITGYAYSQRAHTLFVVLSNGERLALPGLVEIEAETVGTPRPDLGIEPDQWWAARLALGEIDLADDSRKTPRG